MSNYGKDPTVVRGSECVEINAWTIHTSELVNLLNLIQYKNKSNKTIIFFI